jgi:hypothetical protein
MSCQNSVIMVRAAVIMVRAAVIMVRAAVIMVRAAVPSGQPGPNGHTEAQRKAASA